MKNNILFSFDEGRNFHASASKKQDIQRVMAALGIDYEVVLYHRINSNKVFYAVSESNYQYIRPQLFNEYDAQVFMIDGNRLQELERTGEGHHIGYVYFDVPFDQVNRGEREWFALDKGKDGVSYGQITPYKKG